MKYEEIMKLLDAGYSRDEILKMESETPEERQDSGPDPVPSKTPEEEFSSLVQEMRDAFAEMRKEFTALNIMSSHQPPEQERTGDEIIASIINPSMKKNGGK